MSSADAIRAARRAKLQRYWENRAQASVLATDRTEAEVNGATLKAYAASTNALEDALRASYERFAGKGGLSVDDARRTLSIRERDDFRADLAAKQEAIRNLPAFRDGGPLSEQLKGYLDELGEASKLRKVTLQQRLLLEFEHELNTMSAGVAGKLEKGMAKAFAQRLEGNAKDLAKVPKFEAHLGDPAPALLKQAAEAKWLGQNFSERLWQNKAELIDELRRTLTQAAVSHSGIEAMTKKLAKTMGSSLDDTRRLVRTELNYVANQATLESYRADGVKHYKFLAAIDSRTSEVCREANGTVFAVAEAKVGVNFPPLHPNCRSVTVAVFKDEDLAERYDFSHIQLSDDELEELGLSRKDDLEADKPISLTHREAKRAEDAVSKAPLEGDSLRAQGRIERLGEDLRFETKLEATLDRGELPHTASTVEMRRQRIKELRTRLVGEEGRVGELEGRVVWVKPTGRARKPSRIERLVESARAGLERWKGHFNALVERFIVLVTEVMGPEQALAGANLSLMVGKRGRGLLGMPDENERKELEDAADRLIEAEKKRRERLGLSERDDELFEKLRQSHPQVRRKDVVAIDTNAKGGIVYLDRGGLRHLVEKRLELARLFGSEEQIIEGLLFALKKGEKIGRQKEKSSKGDTDPRILYRCVWLGREIVIGINIEHNTRRIFGANPR